MKRRREHLLAAAGVGLWVLSAPVAAAGAASGGEDDVRRYIDAAAKLYEALDYDQALEQLAHAKALGPRADDGVEISLYEGIIYADLSGHRDQSQAAFRAALVLRPDAKLPVKVSPKVEREFEALRKQVLLEQVKASKRAPPRAPSPSGTDRPVAAAPAPSLVPAAPPPPPSSPPSGPSVFGVRVPLVPAALGGVAVAAGVTGTVFGLMTRSSLEQAQNATYQDEAYAHWQAANHTAPVANTLFVAAGVLAGSAVATYFLMPRP